MAGLSHIVIIFISLSLFFLFAFLAGACYVLWRLGNFRQPNSTANEVPGIQSSNSLSKKLLRCLCWEKQTGIESPGAPENAPRVKPENVPHSFKTADISELCRPPNFSAKINEEEREAVDSPESSPVFTQRMEECYRDEAFRRSIGEWSFLRRCPEGTVDKFCY
ncbi:hypothetical protein Nepgr_028281 [Nepenthes gracilis]|uniref:Uncharacterized protein n=1 Tax=Nepenthes gracilis TaxID=150966 RepID=A0AAD3TC19_NEPGR|nr:hypothetical protein Nepgr_028281 [Nepenthes gracilis]